MQRLPGGTMLARRFAVVGNDEAAIATAGRLHDSLGISASLFYLGEYVDDAAAIDRTVEASVDAVHLLGAAGLDVHVSVDPTSIGYLRGDKLCQGNAVSTCRSAPTGGPTRSAASARVPETRCCLAERCWVEGTGCHEERRDNLRRAPTDGGPSHRATCLHTHQGGSRRPCHLRLRRPDRAVIRRCRHPRPSIRRRRLAH